MLLLATCFVILKIIDAAVIQDPRSVHVALETALTFNKKDRSANVKFLDEFQSFLSKVRNTVADKEDVPNRRNYDRSMETDIESSTPASNLKFTDFIKELIVILQSYNDEELEDVFAVIDDEIRKYHYKGCKFYEIVSINNMRRLIAEKLDQIKKNAAKDIRVNLEEILVLIESAKFENEKSDMLDYINSLYTKNDAKRFQEVLQYFQMYQNKFKRSDMDLIALVRNSIRSVVFDHYSNLNINTRRDLKAKIETYFWNNMGGNDGVRQLRWTVKYDDVPDLREVGSQPAIPEKDFSIDKYLQQIFVNNDQAKDNDNLMKTINLKMKLENALDIIKLAKNSKREKENRTVPIETKDFSETILKNNPKRQHELVLENSEQSESDNDENVVTSNENDKSDSNIGHTIKGYKDEEENESEMNLSMDIKPFKQMKHVTSMFLEESSENEKRYKKGFTNNIIARRNTKEQQYKDMTNEDIYVIKPKIQKYQKETTLDSRNRMHALWAESRYTKKHYENIGAEVANRTQTLWVESFTKKQHQNSRSEHVNKGLNAYNSNEVTTIKIADLNSDVRKKRRDLKYDKKKYRFKARDSNENTRSKYSPEESDYKEISKQNDFYLNAQVNVYPDTRNGLKYKLKSPKKTGSHRKPLRTYIKTDEESETSRENSFSGKHKIIKKAHTTTKQRKQSGESMEEEIATDFTKRHKKIARSKHKVQNPIEDESYSPEDKDFAPTKSRKKAKKRYKIQTSRSSEKQKSSESTAKENENSEENEIEIKTKTKKVKKKQKIFKKKTSPAYKRQESTEESETSLGEPLEMTESITNYTSKSMYTSIAFTDYINEHKKEYKEKSHERQERSHSNRTKFKFSKNPFKKSVENEVPSRDKLTKHLQFYTDKTNVKMPVKDIFISIESKEYQPMLQAATKSKLTVKSIPVTSIPKTKEKVYDNKGKNSLMLPKYEELFNKINITNYSFYKPKPTRPKLETKTAATFTTTKATTQKIYKAMNIPIKANAKGILSHKLFLRTSNESGIKPNGSTFVYNSTKSLRRTNDLEDHESTESYLKLVDLTNNNAGIEIDLNTMTTASTTEITQTNKYLLPGFRERHNNNVTIKTSNVTDTTTTTTTPTTEITTTTNITNATNTVNANTNIQKLRKKRRRRRTTTTTSTTPTPTSKPITNTNDNTITTIITTEYRKINDINVPNNPDILKAEEIVTTNFNQELDETKTDYPDYNTVMTEFDNTTQPTIEEEFQEFLDKHNIKVGQNYTNLDNNAVNEILGLNPEKNARPDIQAELIEEKARRRVDMDMMKLYGKTVSHITVSTTPWNTLYTDPIDNLNDLIEINLL